MAGVSVAGLATGIGVGVGEAGTGVGRGEVGVAPGAQAETISERRKIAEKKRLEDLKGIRRFYQPALRVNSESVNCLSDSSSMVTPSPGWSGTVIVLSSFRTKRSFVMSRW